MTTRSLMLALLVVVLCAPALAAAAEPPPAELPTYAPGDRWIRSDGLYEMVRVEDGQYVFASGPGRQMRLSRTLGPALLQRGTTVMTFSPAFDLKWPLRIGDVQRAYGTWHVPPRPDRGPREPFEVPAIFTTRVAAWEEVTVTAGRIGAYRIEFVAAAVPRQDRSGPLAGGAHMRFEAWYAPSVRQYVKVASPNAGLIAYEVVAFDHAPTGPLELVIEEPRDQAKVAQETLPVGVTLRSPRGVSRVTLSVN
ncbi:MAG TPA: hypothetical protein VFL90_03735, partial [Methylomirabilota bacterium]|nr:hypothetical protein [Methylomirabilota bacterium]